MTVKLTQTNSQMENFFTQCSKVLEQRFKGGNKLFQEENYKPCPPMELYVISLETSLVHNFTETGEAKLSST